MSSAGLTITGGPRVTSAGIDAGAKQISNVAAGVANTDAVNMAQLATVKQVADQTQNKTLFLSINSTLDAGDTLDGATGADAIAMGKKTSASGDSSIAQGYQATATGQHSIALGHQALAQGAQSISIGTGNKVLASRAGAIGDPTTIALGADGAYSVGNDNTINATNTFVLGSNVTSDLAGSVILGTGSDGTAASKYVQAKSAMINGVNYDGFAGAGALSDGAVLSIGGAGAERQIKHVAAGQITASSTDAINGSQLYVVAQS